MALYLSADVAALDGFCSSFPEQSSSVNFEFSDLVEDFSHWFKYCALPARLILRLFVEAFHRPEADRMALGIDLSAFTVESTSKSGRGGAKKSMKVWRVT